MERHEYPPAGVVHTADCEDAPPGLLTLPAQALRGSHDRPHRCVNSAAVAANRPLVIERVAYEPHPYEESTIHPVDATKPLCRTCRGTHGVDPAAYRPQQPTLLLPR
ncbi:hypothetical protein [Actinoplanes teichomyceticus]|uniref:Uncharacterized protein n=1 Tax=Actinoplanes teichomyceticus TaxID=1867 RepID=A0A561WSC0_ACTTI|nr:hypothetical protein [Actinoplanes teichomyceticus]TWG26746.1 hypothetical protein FHX34_1011744 [Actinoplanes teichomyceticus]GIF15145.1 hypothetical protein Ate01nite_51770 [Actinoplanes teichomyceticus]